VSALLAAFEHMRFNVAVTIVMLAQIAGCISEDVDDRSLAARYQQALADRGPQERLGTKGSHLLRPAPTAGLPELEVVKDPNTGRSLVNLSMGDAIARALANSPEITVVSFDPSIAKQDIIKEVAEFDIVAFGRVSYEQRDEPVNSLLQIGQAESRVAESGIKQRGVTGSEWSASYALTRRWDDLVGRTVSTRYEPVVAFQLKQPLLRDAWPEVNLAGVNVAKLNHQVALLGFRQKAEEVSTAVISAYWLLLQARRDLEIQQSLLDQAVETLKKLQDRQEIDATDVQVKQAEASLKTREAALLQAGKTVTDAQDSLVRLMADPQMHTLRDLEIVPVTEPPMSRGQLHPSEIIDRAMESNPAIQQAQAGIAIADINVRVAENQRMPRVDLVASATAQAFARFPGDAHDTLDDGDYVSYAIGLTIEEPIGNRQREAELLRRKFERKKAVSILHNLADQVAVQAKERIREVETRHAQIQVQKEAVEAARIHLQALEDSEAIRERLTPEFLLVKLQAQDSLAFSQRAQVKAIVDFNIALVELARTTGTVLELHRVEAALPPVSSE